MGDDDHGFSAQREGVEGAELIAPSFKHPMELLQVQLQEVAQERQTPWSRQFGYASHSCQPKVSRILTQSRIARHWGQTTMPYLRIKPPGAARDVPAKAQFTRREMVLQLTGRLECCLLIRH